MEPPCRPWCYGCGALAVLLVLVTVILWATADGGDDKSLVDLSAAYGSSVTTDCLSPPCRKILCLHGGGMTGPALRELIRDIVNRAGASYQFVFLTAPYAVDGSMPGASVQTFSANWIRDPPGGKAVHTQEPDWDAASLAAIDGVVAAQGPFYGILGYSQGTAAALSYLSHAPANTFTVGMTFCSYEPTTHDGIVQRIDSKAPYSIPMFVYMSENDMIISNCMTNAYAAKFSSPTRASSREGSHMPPLLGQPGFDALFGFLATNHTDGSYAPPAPTPSELPGADCDSFFEVLLRLYWWVLLLLALCCGGCVVGCVRSRCCGIVGVRKHRVGTPEIALVLPDHMEGTVVGVGATERTF